MNLSSFGHLLFILFERTNTAVNHLSFFMMELQKMVKMLVEVMIQHYFTTYQDEDSVIYGSLTHEEVSYI
ncbi:hypothetical protein QR42_02125 [Bacillus sp. WP8]|nr:hypothetical protein QR42_02125 [Bacillus sp. WP8]